MELLGHSDASLTNHVYTDANLFGTAEEIQKKPSLPGNDALPDAYELDASRLSAS